jgi:hypothetical protein
VYYFSPLCITSVMMMMTMIITVHAKKVCVTATQTLCLKTVCVCDKLSKSVGAVQKVPNARSHYPPPSARTGKSITIPF